MVFTFWTLKLATILDLPASACGHRPIAFSSESDQKL
jgi:hypothetical protein